MAAILIAGRAPVKTAPTRWDVTPVVTVVLPCHNVPPVVTDVWTQDGEVPVLAEICASEVPIAKSL